MDIIQSLTIEAHKCLQENNFHSFVNDFFSLLKQSTNKLNLLFALDNIFRKLGPQVEIYFSFVMVPEIIHTYKVISRDEQIVLQKLIQTWTFLKCFDALNTQLSELNEYHIIESPLFELYRKQPFQCLTCGVRWSSKQELDSHIEEHSPSFWYNREEQWIHNDISQLDLKHEKKELKIIASSSTLCFKCNELLEKELQEEDFYFVSTTYDKDGNVIHLDCA